MNICGPDRPAHLPFPNRFRRMKHENGSGDVETEHSFLKFSMTHNSVFLDFNFVELFSLLLFETKTNIFNVRRCFSKQVLSLLKLTYQLIKHWFMFSKVCRIQLSWRIDHFFKSYSCQYERMQIKIIQKLHFFRIIYNIFDCVKITNCFFFNDKVQVDPNLFSIKQNR